MKVPANTSGPSGTAPNTNEVTTPKLPPPPRSAQKRSSCSVALAWIGLTGRGHDVRLEEVVDGQPVGARQPADPAAEGQARDAGARDHSGRDRQPVRLRRPVEMAEGRARRDAHPSRVRIDADVRQATQVEHDAALDGPVAGHVVSPTPDREGEPELACRTDDGSDVADTARADDGGRPAVDHPVPDATCVVIAVVAGFDDPSADRIAQSRQRRHRPPPMCPSSRGLARPRTMVDGPAQARRGPSSPVMGHPTLTHPDRSGLALWGDCPSVVASGMLGPSP